MHLAERLEFRAVVVMACDDESFPCTHGLRVSETTAISNRFTTPNGICFTWPAPERETSFVTIVEPASGFLDDLEASGERY